ncbi:hypothetical protein B0J13DRAFT_613117 [Dactylonectria estremocensis]|uniref:Uncharacterized protein n=1 Tax=Dactylonectria estremocensis TaxID=1079267 RepID=A0A9P9DGA9_9HYPO|nr:hypothetical protein B0J13DRAFT_613117 [Dactylonectria estremocensis]
MQLVRPSQPNMYLQSGKREEEVPDSHKLVERLERIENALARVIALGNSIDPSSPSAAGSTLTPPSMTAKAPDECFASLGEQFAAYESNHLLYITSPSALSASNISNGQSHLAGCPLGHITCHNGLPLFSEEGQAWIFSRTGETTTFQKLKAFNKHQQVQPLNKLDGKLDENTKKNILQRNEDLRRQASDYYNKKMPQERKDQTIFRLKKMVLECQQHEDYSQAIQTLLNLAENYGRHGRVLGQGGAGSAKEARSGFAAAEADLRTLIERFANGTSTSDLWESIGQIYEEAEKDPELRDWFKALNKYIRRCLLEQGFILDDTSSQQWNQLYERGRYLLREKYHSHTNRIVDEIKFIADQFDQDAQNKAFAQSLTKLFKDLGQDAEGKPVFKPHLIKDLTETILPSVLKNIAYIPIPRIEFSDPKFDAIIENLVLESDNFMPNVLEIASEHYFRWGRKKISNKNHQTFEVKAAGIQMDLRDVSFHIKRKQGFPSITDTGVMDLLLPGDGFCFKMKVSTAHKKDRQNFFKVEKVDVDFKGLNFKIKQSSHKLLFALAKPLALKFMRKPIQVAVEKAIKDQCNNFDAQLYKVKQEVDRATAVAKSDPTNAPNIYMRYYTAAQKEFGKKKAQAENAVADKKMNVAFTKEDSIFPAINLPGGISTKATEYKELARKGEKWESPVFSIGSANKSTDIPPAPKIQRKAHPVNVGNGTHNGAVNGQGLNGQHFNGVQDLNGPNRKPINEFGTEFPANGLKLTNPAHAGGQIV